MSYNHILKTDFGHRGLQLTVAGAVLSNQNYFDMNTQIKLITTGEIFQNRKEAKLTMGHSNYNRAWRDGEILIITTPSPTDIIY